MSSFVSDVRYALRSLSRSPGFLAAALLTLALGIGVNTAIFSVLRGVLLRPLPYGDADRLMVAGLSLPDYRDLRESTRSFDRMAVLASNRYNLLRADASEQVLGGVVSSEFFPMLGVPRLGRAFTAAEERERLVVISDRLWRTRFAGDSAVLGRTLDLGGVPYTIVGVAAPEFEFPSSEFQLWLPLAGAMDQAPGQAENRSLRIFRAIGHLAPGVAPTAATREVEAISRRLQKDYPDTNAGVDITFAPMRDRVVGRVRTPILVLAAGVSLLLLIACANVASLTLARSSSREREIAIRSALGAGRARIVRQLVTESLVLAAAGGALGMFLTWLAMPVLLRTAPVDFPRLVSVRMDAAVLLYTVAVSLVTGILFGLAPAFRTAGATPGARLKESGRGVGEGAGARRFRHALVVGQIALSVVVLIGAGLLVRSLEKLLHVPAGFEAENLLTFNVNLSEEKVPGTRARLLQAVLDRLSRVPGVRFAAAGTGLPPETPQRATGFAVAGQPIQNPDDARAYFMAVSSGYFRTLGTRLLEGREFTPADRQGAEAVVIVSRGLVRRVFPSGPVVGRTLKLVNPEWPDDWRTIVGVVDDVRYSGLDDPGRAAVYTPFDQTPFLWGYVVLRTSAPPERLPAAVAAEVRRVDPRLVAARIRPMERIVSDSVSQPRFQAFLLSGFALLALLLACIGIAGVVAHSVARRRGEIGVRVALGATSGDVLRLIVGQGFRLVAAGVALGIVAALAVSRLLDGMLYEIGTSDPVTFASIAAVLAGTGLVASWIPAKRALRIDPISALRTE